MATLQSPSQTTISADEHSNERDEVLLKQFCESRCADAFTEIYGRYSRMVFGVCNRVLGNREEVQDAFQATFIVLLQSAEKIKSGSSLSCWLYGTAYRISLDARSKKHRRKEVNVDEDVEPFVEPFEELMMVNELQVLEEELQNLPSMFRNPLRLYYMAEMNSRQIATELGISISAVESRLRRGRAKLKRSLIRRRVGLAVLISSFGLGASAANASVLHANTATSILLAAENASGSALPLGVNELVQKEISQMFVSASKAKLAPLATSMVITLLILCALVSGSAFPGTTTARSRDFSFVELAPSDLNQVSFVVESSQADEDQAGKLIERWFANDGGSISYKFIDGAGKKRSLKIDNSFAAQRNGSKGTMYLDGVKLDPKSMEAMQIIKWMKNWNRPPKYDQPSGTLLNITNGVSFTGYQFVGKDKKLRSIEIDEKTKEVRNMGGAVIKKDSKEWNRIEKWMKSWKPGQLFSSKSTTNGTEYYFLTRDLKKEGVIVAGDRINNKYNKPLDPKSDLAADVREWLPSWRKKKTENSK